MLLAYLPGHVSAAPKTWELQDSAWQQSSTDQQPELPIDPDLRRVQEMIDRHQGKAAKELVVRWIKSNPGHPQHDKALMLLSDACFEYGDRIRAYYFLEELMDKHPASPLFQRALQREYEIADAFLNGYKLKILGMRIQSANDQAIDILYRIQLRSPGSQLAERSLLRTADWYYADGQFDLAGDAYAAYVRQYPRSPLVPRVQLRGAFCSYAQFRGVKFDATPLLDARAQLVALVEDQPTLAREENIPDFINRIDRTFARKLLVTADFYHRTNQPSAAAFYCATLIKVYPDTQEAASAQQMFDRLPASAKSADANPNPIPEAPPVPEAPLSPIPEAK